MSLWQLLYSVSFPPNDGASREERIASELLRVPLFCVPSGEYGLFLASELMEHMSLLWSNDKESSIGTHEGAGCSVGFETISALSTGKNESRCVLLEPGILKCFFSFSGKE